MSDYYITFRSVTAATKGSRSLEAAGVSNVMVRTPKELRLMGCGYSLRVRAAQLQRTREVLVQGAGGYSRIYRREKDGSWQEVAS